MATYGSASNPVTTLTGVNFSDPTNTVYVYIGQVTSFTNCGAEGMPVVSVASQTNVSNVSFTSGTTFSLSFTATASSGAIVLRILPYANLTFNLIGVQAGPTPGGSGTQSDPWTVIDCNFVELATNLFGTWYPSASSPKYVANGSSFAIWDVPDPEIEDGLDHTEPAIPVYGLTYSYDSSVGKYGLHGTIIGNNGDILKVYIYEYNNLEEFEDVFGPYTFVIVGDPPVTTPTLNVKVSGAWKSGKPYVKVNGAWKEASKVYVKVNGAWKESK